MFIIFYSVADHPFFFIKENQSSFGMGGYSSFPSLCCSNSSEFHLSFMKIIYILEKPINIYYLMQKNFCIFIRIRGNFKKYQKKFKNWKYNKKRNY